jgi:hypothetical protein
MRTRRSCYTHSVDCLHDKNNMMWTRRRHAHTNLVLFPFSLVLWSGQCWIFQFMLEAYSLPNLEYTALRSSMVCQIENSIRREGKSEGTFRTCSSNIKSLNYFCTLSMHKWTVLVSKVCQILATIAGIKLTLAISTWQLKKPEASPSQSRIQYHPNTIAVLLMTRSTTKCVRGECIIV